VSPQPPRGQLKQARQDFDIRRPRRHRERRYWPILTFIVVFAIVAVVVWWRVLNSPQNAADSVSCAPTAQALAPHAVSVRVYNATDRNKLAAHVSSTLRTLGFSVIATANDPVQRKVTGIGEIRYGSVGGSQAKLVAAALPGAKLVRDTRTDASIDVALGPAFKLVAKSPAVKAASRHLRVTVIPSGC